MLVLFIVELWAFMATTTETSVILDTNSDTQLRINFNITLMDLSCDYASVDVYVVATPPYPTAPHRTASHRTAPHRTARSMARRIDRRSRRRHPSDAIATSSATVGTMCWVRTPRT